MYVLEVAPCINTLSLYHAILKPVVGVVIAVSKVVSPACIEILLAEITAVGKTFTVNTETADAVGVVQVAFDNNALYR
jgi:hypothetical protein